MAKYSVEYAGGWQGLLQNFAGDLHIHIVQSSPKLTGVHAGVVLLPQGVLVFPGKSWKGKTTLVKALCEAGALYFSDEYALVDDEGDIHAFPRALSMRSSIGGSTRTDESFWKLSTPTVGLPLAWIDLEYRQGTPSTFLLAAKSQAFVTAFENVVTETGQHSRALRRLTRSLERSECLVGTRGESAISAIALIERFGGVQGP